MVQLADFESDTIQLHSGVTFEADAVCLNGQIVYKPQPRQIEFHTSNAPYVLFGGARGGGKTFTNIWEAIITCLTVPGCDCLILRRTYPELKKTVFNEFSKIPHQVYSENPKAFNRSDKVVNFDNGSHLWFGSCRSEEDIRAYLGGSYLYVGIDEVSEWTYFMWESLKGCNRCPIKFDIHGNPVITKLCGFTNPGGIGHQFLKNLFLDGKPAPGMDASTYVREDHQFVKSLVFDNATYATDEAYMAKLNSLSPTMRAMYRDGDWNIFAGQYFGCFSPARSVITEDESVQLRASQQWQPHWVSIDWGFHHHASASWGTNVDRFRPNGSKRNHTLKYREFVTTGLGEAALAQEIVRLNSGQKLDRIYLSPDCFGEGPTRAKVMGDVFIANGLPRPTPASNDREEGWRYLYELLDGQEDYSELLISDACEQTIEAIPLAIRDAPKKPDDVKKTDAKSDDILDDLRYLTYSRRKPNDKPKEVQKAEALAPFVEQQNYTQAHLAALRFEAEYKAKNKPVYFKRRRR